MNILSEKEYKPLSEDGIQFGFKQKMQLFKLGFNNSKKGLLSLLFMLILWMLLSFVVSYLGFDLVKKWFIFNGKEFLQTQEPLDYLMSILFFMLFSFGYNLQQYITTFNISKIENKIENQFVYFLKKLPLFIFSVIITGIIMFLCLYFSGGVYVRILNDFGSLESFIANASWLIILKDLFLFFLGLLFLYLNNLSVNVLYVAEGNNPIKQNIFKKYFLSCRKTIKIFNLIIPTIISHVFVSLLAILICYQFYNVFIDVFSRYYSLKEVTNQVTLTILKEQIIVGSVFLSISIFILMYSFFNRARIRSFMLITLLTENFEEYKQRLVYPEKISENKN